MRREGAMEPIRDRMPVVGRAWEVGPYSWDEGEWRTVTVEHVGPGSRFVADGEVYWVGHSNNRAPHVDAPASGQLDLFGGAT